MTAEQKKQRWIVGVDLRRHSDGAVRFGAWMHVQAPDMVELVGIHALDLNDVAHVTLTRERVGLAAEQAIEGAGARAAFVEVEVVGADHPVEALETAQRDEAARGIIIGRRAGVGETRLIRLGSVARRLLRRLPAPTFIVPPDLEIGQIGAGPILVAVTPDEPSVGAVKLGKTLATALRRPLVFVTAVASPADFLPPDLVNTVREERRTQRVNSVEAQTHAWLLQQGVSERLIVRRGGELLEIHATARELAAPFIVCGSRLLSLAKRVFDGSFSSELAAAATVPVLVVPPDAET